MAMAGSTYTVEQQAFIQDHATQLGMTPEAFVAAQAISGLDMQTFAVEQLAAAALLTRQQQALNTPMAPVPPPSTPSITDLVAMLTQQNAQQQQAMLQMQRMFSQYMMGTASGGPGIQPVQASAEAPLC